MKKEFSLSTIGLLLLIIIICVGLYLTLVTPSAEAPATVEVSNELSDDPGRLDVTETIEELVGPQMDLSFEHTVPGEYSEITVRRRGTPGDEVTLTVTGEGTGYKNERVVTADENGEILETFRIFQFDNYWVQSDSAINGYRELSSIRVN